MSRPNPLFQAPADTSALPTGEPRVDLRLWDGAIVKDVDLEAAKRIVARCLGEWVGSGRRRYVRLAKNILALPAGFLAGMKTTQRAKNESGGWIGSANSTQEHKQQ